MASILILSEKGSGVPLGYRFAYEGHIAKIYFKKDQGSLLDGVKNPSKIRRYDTMLDQYDLVLADSSGMGDLCEELRQKGKIVIGGGTFNDKLELDRTYGEKVARSVLEVDVPETEECTTTEDLLKCLREAGGPMVVKPHDNKSTCLTLVSGDKANRTLLSLAENVKDLCPCIVQPKVEGIEISSEGWFDGKKFTSFNHTIEQKRLMEKDKGPQTGCMGNVVWACGEDKLIKAAILPLAPLLEKVKFMGPIDVNCIISEKKATFLEFTPRFGYDAIFAYTEVLKGGLFDFLYKFATGRGGDKPYNYYGISVRMSLPPYPFKDGLKNLEGVQSIDVPEPAKNHIWYWDVMQKNGTPVCAGVDGIICSVSARGVDVHEARRRAYRTVNSIGIHPDLQWRSDIGSEVERQIKDLKEWGWLA